MLRIEQVAYRIAVPVITACIALTHRHRTPVWFYKPVLKCLSWQYRVEDRALDRVIAARRLQRAAR